MKNYIALIALALALPCVAQVANVQKTLADDRLTSNIKVPTGKAITVESGGSATFASGSTVTFAVPLSLANGGLGVALVDPNADRILFWDDSAGTYQWLTLGTNLSITGTTINAVSGMANPMTTAGDLIYGGSSGTPARLAIGANGKILRVSGGVIVWGDEAELPDPTGHTGEYLRTDGWHSIDPSLTTLTWGSSTALDFANPLQTVTLAGNTTFTTSNRAAAKQISVRIICDGTGRTLTWPAGWTWIVGAAPSSIAASKTALLSLISFTTADSGVIAAYGVQP